MAAMAHLDPATRARLAEGLAALLAAFQATGEPGRPPVASTPKGPSLETGR
jgi:hypothetical protein